MQYVWQQEAWPNFTWDSDVLLNHLSKARLAQGKLISKIQLLGVDFNLEAQSELLIEETIKTSEIEGASLNPQSVRSSVARRLELDTGGLSAVDKHTDGLVEVLIDAVSNFKAPLTLDRLCSWQAALFPTGYSGLSKVRTGEWRGEEPMQVVSGYYGRETIHFEAPPHDQLEQEMEDFIGWWNQSEKELDSLLRAGIAHFYFVTIHPFEDGNGRIARALTDLALAQAEKSNMRVYSLSERIMKERDQYYQVLEKCQKGEGDITDWLKWFLGCFERAICDAEIIIEKVLAKAKFWKNHSQTILNDRQQKVIGKLLDAGPGKFEGGMTTKKYVSIAQISRATATREIADLLEKKVLVQNEGKGRNVNYDLNWSK
jgi:Fic family protein